ncbi:MAG: peptidoglycan bridge formation glycyltransferase FemA/FemB family protein [Galactobacter sp.]
MRLSRVSESEYSEYIDTQSRVFYTQLPGYGSTRKAEGYTVDYVGLRRDNGVLAGVALLVFQPWKKLFRRVTVPYGPVLDWSDADLVQEFLSGLVGYLRRDPRTLSIRLNPPVAARSYEDITPGDPNPNVAALEAAVATLDGVHVDREFYDSSDIQVRFSYTKDIEGQTYKQIASSVAQGARTGFNKLGTNGVEVRFLDVNQFDVLERVLGHTAQRTDMHEISAGASKFYRDLKDHLGDDVMAPAAVLDCVSALQGIADEREQVQAQITEIEELEVQMEAEGKVLNKKRRNALKEHRDRIGVLKRREDETRAVQKEHGDEVVLAASLFVHSPGELVYLLSGAYDEFQSYYGIYLIHRTMLEWCIEHQVGTYNLYGITGDFSDTASDHGVLQFKRQFGGNVEELVGTYDLPVHAFLAKRLGALG